MVARITRTFALLAALLLTGCTAPDGPLCESDSDCASGEICLGSGGVFFGGSYCAPLGSAEPDGGITPTPDAGMDTGGTPECNVESACDGVDNDGDMVIDEGCSCAFGSMAQGVCLNGIIACDGTCTQPDGFEPDETTCDGLDNDCDGEIDEGQTFSGVSVAAGANHTCALDSAGQPFCWGQNTDGQLGLGTFEPSSQPQAVVTPAAFSKLSAGDSHTCGIGADNGAVFCWGRNDSNQVDDVIDTALSSPVRLEPRGNVPWTDIAAGGDFTCAISDGAVFCWGANDLGQSGQPPGAPISTPTAIELTQDVVFDRVTAGREHACAWLVDSPIAYCWGNPQDGRLARADSAQPNAPAPIESAMATRFVEVSAGTNHTCAFVTTTDASSVEQQVVLCAGSNATRQLGPMANVGGPTAVTPAQVATGPVEAGDGFTCSYRDGTGVGCWGENSDGQVDPDSTESPLGPTLVEALLPDAQNPSILDIAVGGRHACGVTEDVIRCWGANDFGQLGSSDANAVGVVDVACAL